MVRIGCRATSCVICLAWAVGGVKNLTDGLEESGLTTHDGQSPAYYRFFDSAEAHIFGSVGNS